MKILCFIDTLGAGGAQRQLVGLAKFLKQDGHDVQVVTYHDNPFYVDDLKNAQVPYNIICTNRSILHRIIDFARYIRREKAGVVISYLEIPSMMACIVKMFNHSFRLIVSERNTTQKMTLGERLRFKMFEVADYVVPNAYAQEKFIRDNFPKLSSKVFTIANFVDTDYFVPKYHDRQEKPEIMIAASIWPPKNTLGMIEAVSILQQRGVKFHISWYGKSETKLEYFESCQAAIAKYGVADCIDLLDKTKEIRCRYQEADYFCLPSFYEGTPNVICEAMSCGLPIVCSQVCDNEIYVEQGDNGFLFNPHSPASMADAIEKIICLSDDEYKSFCQLSRTKAEEKLSKERFTRQYVEIVEMN